MTFKWPLNTSAKTLEDNVLLHTFLKKVLSKLIVNDSNVTHIQSTKVMNKVQSCTVCCKTIYYETCLFGHVYQSDHKGQCLAKVLKERL